MRGAGARARPATRPRAARRSAAGPFQKPLNGVVDAMRARHAAPRPVTAAACARRWPRTRWRTVLSSARAGVIGSVWPGDIGQPGSARCARAAHTGPCWRDMATRRTGARAPRRSDAACQRGRGAQSPRPRRGHGRLRRSGRTSDNGRPAQRCERAGLADTASCTARLGDWTPRRTSSLSLLRPRPSSRSSLRSSLRLRSSSRRRSSSLWPRSPSPAQRV